MRNLSILLIALLVAASARAQSLGDRIGKAGGLSDQYSDFNTRLIQIQTVKSLPFFSKSPQQRLSAIRGYYQNARSGEFGKVGQSLHEDFTNGGLVKDVGIAMMTQVLTQVSQGKSIDESVSTTVKYVTSPEYFIGNLMGGTLGAALGSLIPVPVLGGFLGQVLGNVPAMTGAMLGSNVGSKIVHGIREGNLDIGDIFKSIDWMNLGFQSVGATAGMIIGSGLPVPFLGQLVGGVLGGQAGLWASKWIKGKLHLKGPDEDWIQMPEYDPSTSLKLPPWVKPGGSLETATSVGTVAAVTPGFLPAAPAAPTSSAADLDEQMKAALKSYTVAEATGRKADAATAYSRYSLLKAQLERLKASR